MPEIIINLHMHTQYSDGTGTHQEIAEAAFESGLDGVIVTDHNILVKDKEGYYTIGEKQVLVLVGEEIHDNNTPGRNNHLLVFGAGQELAGLAEDTQKLLDKINDLGGLSFIAHPIDPAAPQFNQGDFSWDKWDVTGFTGIELWNGFSEFKTRLKNIPAALWFAYLPKRIARGPIQEALAIWDRLTSSGKRIVAVGGSDAHAMHASLGPILILPTELTGDFESDQGLIYQSLRAGHAFVGYDLPFPTTGFRFTAASGENRAMMGDEISLQEAATLEIKLPLPAECVLIKDGKPIKKWKNRRHCRFEPAAEGVYRIEVYLPYRARRRGWIYSNPIYIRE
jgi:hypothetical protein